MSTLATLRTKRCLTCISCKFTSQGRFCNGKEIRQPHIEVCGDWSERKPRKRKKKSLAYRMIESGYNVTK